MSHLSTVQSNTVQSNRLKSLALIMTMSVISTLSHAGNVPSDCYSEGAQDVVILNTRCGDDGCLMKVVLEEDFFNLESGKHDGFDARCLDYKACEPLASRSGLVLAEVTFNVSLWDSSGQLTCNARDIDVLF